MHANALLIQFPDGGANGNLRKYVALRGTRHSRVAAFAFALIIMQPDYLRSKWKKHMAVSRLLAFMSMFVLVVSFYAIVPSFAEQEVASVRLKCTERSCISETPPYGSIEFYTADEVDDQLKRQVDALSRKIADLEIQLAKERIKRDLEVQQLTATLAKRLNELPLEVVRHNAAYEMLRNRLIKDLEQVFAPRPNQ